MSERKFNRDQDDTEPVKFKPLYLIIGLCVVVIAISACCIYIFLNQKEKNNVNKETNVNENINEEISEPTEYVIPTTACTRDVTVQTYNNSVFTNCASDNVVLNFTDINMIVDTQRVGASFTVNGIYYDKKEIKTDDYLSSGMFNGITVGANTTDIGMVFTDASVVKKSGFYIFRENNLVYSNGSDSNTLFTLESPIKYTKYEIDSLNIDCKTATDKTKKVYEEGTINFDGDSYKAVFTRNVLVGDICK